MIQSAANAVYRHDCWIYASAQAATLDGLLQQFPRVARERNDVNAGHATYQVLTIP